MLFDAVRDARPRSVNAGKIDARFTLNKTARALDVHRSLRLRSLFPSTNIVSCVGQCVALTACHLPVQTPAKRVVCSTRTKNDRRDGKIPWMKPTGTVHSKLSSHNENNEHKITSSFGSRAFSRYCKQILGLGVHHGCAFCFRKCVQRA